MSALSHDDLHFAAQRTQTLTLVISKASSSDAAANIDNNRAFLKKRKYTPQKQMIWIHSPSEKPSIDEFRKVFDGHPTPICRPQLPDRAAQSRNWHLVEVLMRMQNQWQWVEENGAGWWQNKVMRNPSIRNAELRYAITRWDLPQHVSAHHRHMTKKNKGWLHSKP